MMSVGASHREADFSPQTFETKWGTFGANTIFEAKPPPSMPTPFMLVTWWNFHVSPFEWHFQQAPN